MDRSDTPEKILELEEVVEDAMEEEKRQKRKP